MTIDDFIIYKKTIPAREPVFSDFPTGLEPEIAGYLKHQGIHMLYCHQAEMFEQAKQGKNLVITTSTASGKTLSFLLPVISEILENSMTRAIFVYPTKALAADQYRALFPWIEYFGRNRIDAGVYDGDTPQAERSRIRRQANIILTNPDMLNGAMLPNHSKYGFDFIFSNLKYVVLDELHVYRGAFGSHMANVLRRLSRICRYYHSQPQFLCSSATIANPAELAEKICGTEFVCIDRDGSGTAQREYCLIQPPKITGRDEKYYCQRSVTNVAADMLPELMEQGESFIAFAKSRRNVEVILKETRDHLDGSGFLGTVGADRISGYRGGYTPQERKSIEQRMISGELLGLVSTNALELGIDIGKISSTVLVGYPGTRASFWQQTGRAGRNSKKCTNYLILDQLPMDQYIALEPGWLFEGSSENAIADPDNLLIELAHIRAAAAELPLSLDDMGVFPDLGEVIPVLLKMEEVRNQGGRFAWSGGQYPAGDFSLRNIDKNRYQLLHQETGKVITEMDESQAFHELYEGAVYIHDGEFYQIVKMDMESKMVYAVPFNGNYYTVPGDEINIRIIHCSREQNWKRTDMHFGDINVADYVYMYKKLQFHTQQNIGYQQLASPLSKNYDTEAVWLKLPRNVVRAYRRLLQPDGSGRYVRNNHFDGLSFALKNAALMVTMTEQTDIGVTVSTNAMEVSGQTEDEVFLYFYDCYTGGLGFAEKIFEMMPRVVEQAVRMVSGCKCEDGCAACVGDYRLDRKIVLWGLENLLEESDFPDSRKLVKWADTKWIQKEFRMSELPDRWGEFCEKTRGNGEVYASFFQTVCSVKTAGEALQLFVKDSFYAEWANMPENRTGIQNMIGYYAEVPPLFRVDIFAVPQNEETAEEEAYRKRKLFRRYK